ncbi:MAG: ATP-binding cassette domain-containing protein [Gammaproteobacteria bacterium]|nr:ATP-binding cassette domain-containing protein [Gammaproteobacteria bacterium]
MGGFQLTVKDICFDYGGRRALHRVSLQLRSGEITALLGANGAGKSTLLKAVGGQLVPHAGQILLNGAPLALSDTTRPAAARQALGLVPQSIALYQHLSVGENLLTFGALMGLPRKERQTRARTVAKTIELADRWRDPVTALSGGMQRRLNVGAALMHAPRLLLLDEPTAGIDREGRQRLGELFTKLRADGLGILWVTHELADAERTADRVAILSTGRLLAAGGTEELIRGVFGTSRLVQLDFDVPVTGPLDGPLQPFSSADQTSFEAVLALSPGALDRLLGHCRGTGLRLREVRVTRPGLAQLITHYEKYP